MTATQRSGTSIALAVLGGLFVLAVLALLAIGGGGMMGGSGLGMVGLGMFVVPLVLLGLVIVLVYALANSEDAEPTRSAAPTEDAAPTGSAEEILRQRYARGELTDEEYEARRRTLEERSDG